MVSVPLPTPENGVLDLTGSQLHSLDGVELPIGLTDLDLTLNRLKEMDPRVLELPGLISLSWRQNLLTDATPITQLKSAPVLEQLVLHDNHLKQIPSLKGFPVLSRLELSYNEFRSLQPLAELSSAPLTELFVANNKVTSFEGVQTLTQLQVLEMGSNRIKVVEHLEDMAVLRQLWLGRNRISSLEGFPTLLNLKILALPSNRLTSICGLEACVNLEELYFTHNGIQKMEGLETLSNLLVLDLANNMIERVEGLEAQTRLTDLWLNDNKIQSLDGLQEALVNQKTTLTCVYFENNPLAQSLAYKPTMMEMLPNLEQLDSNDIVR